MLSIKRKLYKTASDAVVTMLSVTLIEPELCPIVATMKMLGNDWNMIAIRYLHDEPMKFNQLKRAMGNVSSKTLSRTLKHLAKEVIVERRVLDTTPISVDTPLLLEAGS